MRFSFRTFSVGFLSVLLFSAGCSALESNSPGPAESALGSAPLFVLTDVQGQDITLQDVLKAHKAVLINFWATWCPPCREEIPDLIRLQEQYGKQSFTVLGVDIAESPAKVSGFMDQMGINYPVVLDKKQKVAQQYRVVGIPTSILLSHEGKVLGEYHSASPQLFADVKKALNNA